MKLALRNTLAVVASAAAIGGLGVSTASAAEAAPAQGAAPASILQSPGPDCADNGGVNPCYEYQTWFWTFDNCNNYAHNNFQAGGRYDTYVCAVFTGGATVGLWYHRVHN